MSSVVWTSTPDSVPENASPEIFSRTRRYFGAAACKLLAVPQCVLREAPNLDLLAEHADDAVDQIADADRVVLDERLVEQAVLLEPLVEFAFDDLLRDLGRLSGRHRGGELAAHALDDVGGHALAVHVLRRHGRNMHGDVAREFAELRIAGNEVGLAVDLDEHADLSAGMDIAGDQPFVGHALRLLLRLRGAALEQFVLRLVHVAAGVDEGL